MKLWKTISASTFAFLITFSNMASAKEYLGLDLGDGTFDSIKKKLQSSDAAFDASYGYEGYSSDLPIIKVTSYSRFDKFGKTKDAWLFFSPDKKLYKISVQWSDSGEIYKVFKDALDTKYGQARENGFGFQTNYQYTYDDIKITLERNTFGFGSDQSTSLVYIYTPAVAEVDEMKTIIDNDIRKKNAATVSADLQLLIEDV